MKEGKENSSNSKVLVILLSFLLLFNLASISANSNVIDFASDVKDFFIEATKGNVAGQTTLNKFGENLAVGTSEEDIRASGGTLVFLQSAELITISSNDGADTLGGANAHSVEVIGLNSDWEEISEIVNLSGATEVNTTKEFIRIYRMRVHEVGTYSVSNAGDIIGVASISGGTQIAIPDGEGQSKTSHYTVPLGKKVIITRISATVNTGKDVDIKLKIRENADDIISPFSPTKTLRDVRGIAVPVSGEPKGNLMFDEKTDIWAVGVTTSGTTSKIEINYDMLLYDK